MLHRITIALGVVLLIGAVAGFVILPQHKPIPAVCPPGGQHFECPAGDQVPHGLAQTPYDALRIGTWALLIVGGVMVAVGLIGYARR